ncbi:MAG: hypothetical protein LBD97_09615, partial [Bifidobacteriaceae bacterium]|nr:hypothetical protein [Bifidobacteriaceae bacterium]
MKSSTKRARRWRLHAAVLAAAVAIGLAPTLGADEAQADPVLPYLDQSLPFNVRAADLVSRMTQEEKASQFFTGMFMAPYQAPAIERLGVHSYNYWNEALHGVARVGAATEFPTGQGIASTWDRDLVHAMTTAISDEARAKTNDCLNAPGATISTWCMGATYWSPTINLARDPRWGRADESYGEDPFLAGELAGQFAQGLQGNRNTSLPDSVGGTTDSYLKAVSTPKHYLANNSEVNRHSGTSNLTDRSLHEYYTAQFGIAVEDYGAKGLMTSYNSVNVDPNYTAVAAQPTIKAELSYQDVAGTPGTPVPANKYAVETLMRRVYGFDGYVTSDCGAVQDTWEVYP